jgi:hypothetical protein
MVSDQIATIPLTRRKSIRALSFQLDIPKSTLHYWKQQQKVCRHYVSSLKPYLTEENRMARVDYALEEVDQQTLDFVDMYDRIHVDEKWFYLTHDKQGYYLANDEEEPKRKCKNKLHITKVMILVAQARPRFNTTTNQWWDGKIGMWPIGKMVPAPRNSVNRPAGTLVWHNTNVTKKVYCELLIDKVLPAIRAKWPGLQRLNNWLLSRFRSSRMVPHLIFSRRTVSIESF